MTAGWRPSSAASRHLLPAIGAKALPTGPSPNEPSRRAPQELHQVLRLGHVRQLRLDPLQRLLEAQLRADQDAIGALQRLDRLLLEALPLQADRVDAVRLRGAVADRLHERQHVLRADRAAADEGVLADAAELVHR